MNLPVVYSALNPSERIKQRNKCFYCSGDLSKPAPKLVTDRKVDWSLFPKDFLKYPLHLQHDHETGLTEGVVHNYCNAVMWQYEGK
jgi:hypothetical protein